MNNHTPTGAAGAELFPKARAIFEAAVERPLAERARLVQNACGDDAGLRAAVEQMLSADAEPMALLDGSPALPTDRWHAGDSFAGHYRIAELIGRGGMGEVYRAHDTTLGRDVALKVLPAAAVESASLDDRLARFQREAQVLAALNHPNIATIHGFETAGGLRALVLELVDGPTLADRIAAGPVPLREAVTIARQIAVGLEAAHEQGVVHRDLKPANIKLRPDGTVKLLDFGLAKVVEPARAAGGVATSGPTAITSPSLIQSGMLLGTAAYMSPEQARGREADRRSDVWAFGAVLYEMLSGARAFKGDDVAETYAAVIRADVDWDALPAETPDALRRLVGRCLERDTRRRLRDIGEARIVLEDGEGSPAGAATLGPAWPATPRDTRQRFAWGAVIVAIAAVAIGIGAGAAWYLKPSASRDVTRLALTLPDAYTLSSGDRSVAAISPDGSKVALIASPPAVYLRSLTTGATNAIRGTEGLGNLGEPVFSPDSQSIVFHASADRTLKRIPVTGGVAVTLCSATFPYGVSWDANGILFMEPGRGILRVSPTGGEPDVLVSLDATQAAQSPQLLPGGTHLLFSLATGSGPDRWDKALIVVQELATGNRTTLIEGGSDARYLSTGHLIYGAGGNLMAVPFDARRLEVRGEAVPIVEGVARGRGGTTGTAHYSVAGNGTLLYINGPALTASLGLGVTDRQGSVEPLNLPPGPYEAPRAAPDGTRIAFGTDDGHEAIVWVYDVSGRTPMRRATFDGNNRFPTWSADSTRIAFQSDREGDLAVFWQLAVGGVAERLTTPGLGEAHEPESWSPDGSVLLFSIKKGADISLWMLSMKDRKLAPFSDVHSSTRTGAVFSRDGRWVAYGRSGPSGKTIYVEPFPPTGAKHQLLDRSAGQPNHPAWSPDGTRLFYNPGPGRFESVSVTTTVALDFGNPTVLHRSFPGAGLTTRRPYDVMRDGRVLSTIVAGQTEPGRPFIPRIQVVLNWFEELKARVP